MFTLPTVTFDRTPLITLRKTAWKKAIREMEWFLSDDSTCPAELRDWWEGQLSPEWEYVGGYSDQLRSFQFTFDQIEALVDGLRTHPFSRRHVITTWNPAVMYSIQELNENPKTPTTCHTTIAQFFCSTSGGVSMHSYQRSADMLLGVPHNWIQSWALLLWVAAQVEGYADKMLWTFGDAHVYMESSHLDVAWALRSIENLCIERFPPRLEYTGKVGDWFDAKDFNMVGTIPEPVILTRPKLL
jgi:thymidylate synthase